MLGTAMKASLFADTSLTREVFNQHPIGFKKSQRDATYRTPCLAGSAVNSQRRGVCKKDITYFLKSKPIPFFYPFTVTFSTVAAFPWVKNKCRRGEKAGRGAPLSPAGRCNTHLKRGARPTFPGEPSLQGVSPAPRPSRGSGGGPGFSRGARVACASPPQKEPPGSVSPPTPSYQFRGKNKHQGDRFVLRTTFNYV